MPRILLVDDDIAEISAVKRVLARSGHQPVLATNASDAMAAVNQLPPDLVIVGSTCENGEALALANKLASGDAGTELRVIVLGEAPGSPPGAPILPRPVDPTQLAEEVARTLASARPAEPPSPPPPPPPPEKANAAKAQPVGRISRPKAIIPPPPDAPAAPAAPGNLRRRQTDLYPPPAAPPRASPVPRHDAPAADPRPVLSVEVTAALEPVAPTREATPRPGGPDRKAAAQALRARAEELRRATPPPRAPSPIPEEVVDDELDALLERPEERPISDFAAELGTDLEAIHQAMPEGPSLTPRSRSAAHQALDAQAERAAQEHAARLVAQEAAAAQAAQEARAAQAEAARLAAEAQAALEAQAAQAAQLEAVAMAAAEEARREAEARAAHEAAARAAREAAARAAEETEAVRQEALRAAEEARHKGAAAEEEARRARDAEARAQAEADARQRLEEELERLRQQMELERRSADDRVAEERQRAAATTDAAEELSRLAEEQAQSRAAEEMRRREEQEEELRRAIESARADMDALRRRNEEEARRRAEVEAELARLTGEAAKRAAAPPAGPAPAFAFPEPAIPMPPPPDPLEEEARLRALARAEGPAADPAAAPPPPALPPPDLRSGALVDVPAPRLLALAWKARLTGRLDFQGAAARSLHFEDGRIVGATSAEPSERLEELALRIGLVTRDQYRQIGPSAAALPARRAALLLLERGYLKANELTSLVRRRAEEIVFGLFADESARFRWVGADVPPEERVGLDRSTLALSIEGVRRRWLSARVDAVLGGAATLLTPAAGPTAAELALSPEERRAVALADGLRTLDEIETASPLDPLSTRQVLAALVLVGSLSIRILGAGRAASLGAAAIDLARVGDKLDQARRADYFTILGVGRLCTPHEVREAADRLAAEFAPGRFAGVREEGLPARLEEILRVVADAREVLADERLREEYLKGLGE
ncbi:MAG: DUF4388 domain-containing protein [Anaeromyxobacteraceae bacterium]